MKRFLTFLLLIVSANIFPDNLVDIQSLNNYSHDIDIENNYYQLVSYYDITGLSFTTSPTSGVIFTTKPLETQNAIYMLTEILDNQGFNTGNFYVDANNYLISVNVTYNNYDTTKTSLNLLIFKYEPDKNIAEMEIIWTFVVVVNEDYYFNNQKNIIEKAFSFYGQDFNGTQRW